MLFTISAGSVIVCPMKRYVQLAGLALLCLTGGVLLLLSTKFGERSWIHQVISSIGEALIVSGILGATVDWFLKEKLLKEASANISKFLIGYDLPAEIQDRIRELMGIRLVRRNFLMHCRMTADSNGSGEVKLEVSASCEVENITNTVQKYTNVLEAEVHDHATLLEVRCDSDDEDASYCYDSQQYVRPKDGEPGQTIMVGKEVGIRPHHRERGIKYLFGFKYEQVHTDTFSESLGFEHSTVGVVVTVEAPEALQVTCYPNADLETKNRWEYKRLFLDGEEITLRWSIKKGTQHSLSQSASV